MIRKSERAVIPQDQVAESQSSPPKCCEHGFIGMDASYIYESGVGSHPIVTVKFALEDWASRDAFVKHFRCNPLTPR